MGLRIEGGPTDKLANHPDASYRNYTARVHLNAINNAPLIVPCHLASTFSSSLCPLCVCERDARCVADGPRELGLRLFSRATSQLSNPGPVLRFPSSSFLLGQTSSVFEFARLSAHAIPFRIMCPRIRAHCDARFRRRKGSKWFSPSFEICQKRKTGSTRVS